MAGLATFACRKEQSILHLLDARIKFLLLALIGASCLNASPYGILFLFALVLVGFVCAGAGFRGLFKDLRFFLLFLFFVCALRAFGAGGKSLFEIYGISFSEAGLKEGAVFCLRLLVFALSGLLFAATTKMMELKAVIKWILKPFPFIPGGIISTMIGLMMRFIPVILKETEEISDAQKARCIEYRKNPIHRAVGFTVPLLVKTFNNAEKIAVSMDARCYSEKRTAYSFSLKKKDWMVLFAVLSVCIAIVLYL
jgi:energy-coupling factor transporter transmembrane protein EcfT